MEKDLEYYRRQENKMKNYQQKYYQNKDNKKKHAEYYKKKVTCKVCNCEYQRSNLTHHIQSKKHLRNLAANGDEDEVNRILTKYKMIEEDIDTEIDDTESDTTVYFTDYEDIELDEELEKERLQEEELEKQTEENKEILKEWQDAKKRHKNKSNSVSDYDTLKCILCKERYLRCKEIDHKKSIFHKFINELSVYERDYEKFTEYMKTSINHYSNKYPEKSDKDILKLAKKAWKKHSSKSK